jgi:hypothetical protein
MKTQLAIGAAYIAALTASGEIVSIKDFNVETELSSTSASRYISKDQRVGDLLLLNSYVVGRGWSDSGVIAARDHFICDINAGTVEWHIDGIRLTYVLVETGYKSYRLYKVTPEEAFDSGTPQYIGGLAPILGFSKDDSKEFGDFKGGGVGAIYFYGVETESQVEEFFYGGTAGGGSCSGGGGGHHPHPKPTPQPSTTPTPAPTATPTPAPTCHMTPPPSPTPCTHNVPESGDSLGLLALGLAVIALVASFVTGTKKG